MSNKDATSQMLKPEQVKSPEERRTQWRTENSQHAPRQRHDSESSIGTDTTTAVVQNHRALAGIVIGSSFLGIIGLISPFVIMQLRSPLPYMSTPRRKILAALEEIASRKKTRRIDGISTSDGSSGGTQRLSPRFDADSHRNTAAAAPPEPPRRLQYYDLGSGDGETVLAAAEAGWSATGVELNSTLWALSCLRRSFLFSTVPVRRRSRFVWGDMWSQSVRDADAVMVFGVTPLMPKVAEKIASECRPGTFVMSYRFRVPLLSGLNVDRRKFEVGGEVSGDGDGSVCGDGMGVVKGVLNADIVYDVEEMRIYQLRGDAQGKSSQDVL